jgi:hypothetical protein
MAFAVPAGYSLAPSGQLVDNSTGLYATPGSVQLPGGYTLTSTGFVVNSSGQPLINANGQPNEPIAPAGTPTTPASNPATPGQPGNPTDPNALVQPSQMAGTIWGAGPTVPSPQSPAFNEQIANAASLAKQYGSLGQTALRNAAPQITGLGTYTGEMGSLARQYAGLANNDTLAQQEYQNALGQSLQANTAMARSATGGAIGQAGAERAAIQANAGSLAGAAGNAGLLQGQLQQGYLGMEQGAYGAQLTANQAQAALQEQQNQANYGFAQGMYGLQNNSSQAGLSGVQGFTNATNQAAETQIASDQLQAQTTGALVSGVAGAGAGLLSTVAGGGGGGGGTTGSSVGATTANSNASYGPGSQQSNNSGYAAPAPVDDSTTPTPDTSGDVSLSGTGGTINAYPGGTSDEDSKEPPEGSFGSNGLPPLINPDTPTPAQALESQDEAQEQVNYVPQNIAHSGIVPPAANSAANPSDQTGEDVLSSIILGLAKAAASSSVSDEREKAPSLGAQSGSGTMDAPDALVDEFLRRLDPKAFRYKDPSNEPISHPHGGEYLGVMAQDLEKMPNGIGQQLVDSEPGAYKRVNTFPLATSLAAGLGRLNQRVMDLEGKRGS